MTYAGRAAAVLVCIRDLVARSSIATAQIQLVQEALRELDTSGDALPSIRLPLDVYEAIRGSWEAAVPVAAASTCVYLGADLLDNVADRELPPHWSVDTATLAATSLLASLPYLALDLLCEQAGVPIQRILGLVRRVAAGTWAMAGGQARDIESSVQQAITPEAVVARIALKSGAEFRLFAGLGASLATEDARLITAYEAYGYAVGIAAQVRSDCHDIWVARPSDDLLNGRLTLPVAHALASVPPDQHGELVAILQRARSDPGNHTEVASRLAATGSLRYAAATVERWIRHGEVALEQALPDPPAGERLRADLRGLSLLQHA